MFTSPNLSEILQYIDWEVLWSPYDEGTYQFVLEQIKPQDIILEIGSGDLRLSQRLAEICQRVEAIEIQESIINNTLMKVTKPLPANLKVHCADARTMDFPKDVTKGVLLMRHCNHFRLYVDKLRQIGATHLITNSRWRMGVEVMSLQSAKISHKDLPYGWYACWCGAIGFKECQADLITAEIFDLVNEVVDCPTCIVDKN